MASQADRLTAVIAGVATVALYGASTALLVEPEADRDFDVIAWSVVAVAVGVAVRSRRAYLAEVEERIRRADLSREEEARRGSWRSACGSHASCTTSSRTGWP